MKIGFAVPQTLSWIKAIETISEYAARTPGAVVELFHGESACHQKIEELEILVTHKLSDSELEQAQSLKALFVPIVGLNQLPIEALQRRQIAVHNCHGNAFSVAERALALALAGIGRIVEYHNDLSRELWHGFWIGKGKEDFWHSIRGLSCAILGTGAIARQLAIFLKAFECRVTGFRRQASYEDIPGFDHITTSLAAALSGARLVFVTLPATDATRGLIGTKEFELMTGSFLVNVGRAEVIVEAALYEALQTGQLVGAGLDVWYQYPQDGCVSRPPSKYPIHQLPNVVLSPHVAGSTFEAAELNISDTAINLLRYLQTGEALHRVDLAAQY